MNPMKNKITNIQIIPPGGYHKEFEFKQNYTIKNWVLEISYELTNPLIVGYGSLGELQKRLNIELGENYEDFEEGFDFGSSTNNG